MVDKQLKLGQGQVGQDQTRTLDYVGQRGGHPEHGRHRCQEQRGEPEAAVGKMDLGIVEKWLLVLLAHDLGVDAVQKLGEEVPLLGVDFKIVDVESFLGNLGHRVNQLLVGLRRGHGLHSGLGGRR